MPAIKQSSLSVSLLLALHGAWLCAVPIEARERPHRAAASRGTCPTTRNLAPASWDARPIAVATLDRMESSTRGAGGTPAVPAGADVVLRSFAGASETLEEPTDSVATVWRDGGHVWHVDKVDFRTRPEASRPPGAQGQDDRRRVTAGVMHPQDGARLDLLVDDPCLYLEPTAPDAELFVRDGVTPEDPCYSGAGGIVEIRRGSTRLVFNLFCPRLLAGELLRVALYPRLMDGKPITLPRTHGFETKAEAYAMIERKRAYYGLSADWENATTSPVPEIRNRRRHIACRLIGDGALFDFDPANPDRAAGCASTDLDGFSTSSLFMAKERMSPRNFAARYAPAERHEPRPSAEALASDVKDRRLDGMRVSTLQLIDGPRGDARKEQYSRSYAAVIGAYLVATHVTGPVTRRWEVDRRALAEWRWLREPR